MGTITPGVNPGTLSPSAAKLTFVSWAFSASYTTGGEAITAAQCGLSTLFAVVPTITGVAGSATEVTYNRSTAKLQAFGTAGEIAAATNLAALTCDLLCIGTY